MIRLRAVGVSTVFLLAVSFAIAAVLAGIAALFALSTGRDVQDVVASSLVLGGAAIVAWNVAVSNAAPLARHAQADWFREVSRLPAPTPMPFEWVVVGLLVIGFGVLSVVVCRPGAPCPPSRSPAARRSAR